MVEKISALTQTILYAARRDCRATARPQIMISLRPPPYYENRKCVSNHINSILASCLHIETRHNDAWFNKCGSLCAHLWTKRCRPICLPTGFWSKTTGNSPDLQGTERLGISRENFERVRELFLIISRFHLVSFTLLMFRFSFLALHIVCPNLSPAAVSFQTTCCFKISSCCLKISS